MGKRVLSASASDFRAMDKGELLAAIGHSEGRVIACETIGCIQPMLGTITNAEFAASQGADLLLLNMFDVWKPKVYGLPDCPPEETIRLLEKLTGRPIGLNLEPVEEGASEVETDEMWAMTAGRLGTVKNAVRAAEMGARFLVLTGNPGMGVSNPAIVSALQNIRAAVGDKLILIAGKMHAAGIAAEGGEHILTADDVRAFAEAGADMILMPAPGTVPGITTEYVRSLIALAHSLGLLAMTAIGTSQEGADTATIRQIALQCKMAGADVHHLGDAGYGGMALPENIFAYSVAVRGIRHTYFRQAASIYR